MNILFKHSAPNSLTEKTNNGKLEAYNDTEERIGYIDYHMEGSLCYLDHTFVDPNFRGGSVAAKLVDELARIAQSNEWELIPVCSYAVAHLSHSK